MQKHFFIWDNPRDAVIWITLMLLAIGCINVFSASFVEATDMFGDGYFYLKRYVAFAAAGFAVMLYLGLRGPDYHLWLSKHWLNIIYVAVLFLLIAVELDGRYNQGRTALAVYRAVQLAAFGAGKAGGNYGVRRRAGQAAEKTSAPGIV